MADERGASRDGEKPAEPGAKTKKRVRTRQPTLIGMAIEKDGDDASPPEVQTRSPAAIPPPAMPAAKVPPKESAGPVSKAKPTGGKVPSPSRLTGTPFPKPSSRLADKKSVPPPVPAAAKSSPPPSPSGRVKSAPPPPPSGAKSSPPPPPSAKSSPERLPEKKASPSQIPSPRLAPVSSDVDTAASIASPPEDATTPPRTDPSPPPGSRAAASRPAGRPADVATSPATPMPAYGEAPTSPAIDLPGEGEDGAAELPAEATQITGPDDDEAFIAAGGDEPLEGESTQVAAAPEGGGDSVPPDLAMEPTLPAASVAAHDPPVAATAPLSDDASLGAPSVEYDGDFQAPPTQVVGPQAGDAQTYSFDVESGEVALSKESTWVGDEPVAPKKVPIGLVIGLVAGGLALVGLGLVGTLWLLSGDEEGEPVAVAGATREPDPAAVADTPEAPAEGDPGAAAEQAAAGATEEGEGDDEPAEAGQGDDEAAAADDAEGDAEGEAGEEDDADEAAPTPSGEVVPREQLESFELDRPRLSRRARRMNEGQRRRMTNRLKGRALAAYRRDEHAEAERLYREALTYNTWDVAAVEGLARATAQQGRYPEALAWAELAVDRNPRSAAAYRVLGDVWNQAGHPDEARRAYRRGLRRSPRDRWLRQRLRDLEEDD